VRLGARRPRVGAAPAMPVSGPLIHHRNPKLCSFYSFFSYLDRRRRPCSHGESWIAVSLPPPEARFADIRPVRPMLQSHTSYECRDFCRQDARPTYCSTNLTNDGIDSRSQQARHSTYLGPCEVYGAWRRGASEILCHTSPVNNADKLAPVRAYQEE
jgi:hypothetical protein